MAFCTINPHRVTNDMTINKTDREISNVLYNGWNITRMPWNQLCTSSKNNSSIMNWRCNRVAEIDSVYNLIECRWIDNKRILTECSHQRMIEAALENMLRARGNSQWVIPKRIRICHAIEFGRIYHDPRNTDFIGIAQTICVCIKVYVTIYYRTTIEIIEDRWIKNRTTLFIVRNL